MFWDRFVSLCEANGVKPTPLGKELGISSAAITKWKNGAIPNAELLIKLADRFNVSLDYLLGREYNKHENKEITFVSSSDKSEDKFTTVNINEQKLLEKFRILTYEQQIHIMSEVIKETENPNEE